MIETIAPTEYPATESVPTRSVGLIVRCLAAVAAVGSAGWTLISIWSIATAANHGFSIDDEGLYIASADAPGPEYGFAGIWGSYTGLLFDLVGKDITAFRLAALGVLLLAGGFCGWQVFAVFRSRIAAELVPWAHIGMVTLGISGALMFHRLFLLTPSYNWLCMVGLLTCFGATLWTLNAATHRRQAVAAGVVALGCWSALAGRPTAGVGAFVAFALLVLVAGSGTIKWRFATVGWSVVTLAGLAALHLILVAGPAATAENLARTKDLTALDPSHSTQAILDITAFQYGNLPRDVWAMAGPLLLIGLLPLLLLVFRPLRSAAARSAPIVAVIGVVAVTADQTLAGRPLNFVATTAEYTAILVAGVLGWITVTLTKRFDPTRTAPQAASRRVAPAVVLMGTGLAVLYGLSSDWGPVAKSGEAVAFLILAAAACCLAMAAPRWAIVGVLTLSLAQASLTWQTVQWGRDHPYRTAPVSESNVATVVTPDGSTLMLTAAQAQYFQELAELRDSGRFPAGTPLIDLTPFSPMAGYVLEARPTSVIYLGSPAMAQYVLERDGSEMSDAWLLVDEQPTKYSLDPKWAARYLGKRFPADYQLEATLEWPFCARHNAPCEHQLWRPKSGT